jgi:hypothetical protein
MARRHLFQRVGDEAALAVVHFPCFFRLSLVPLESKLAIIRYLLCPLFFQLGDDQGIVKLLV